MMLTTATMTSQMFKDLKEQFCMNDAVVQAINADRYVFCERSEHFKLQKTILMYILTYLVPVNCASIGYVLNNQL